VSVDQLRPQIKRLAQRASIHAYNWMLRDEPDVDELTQQLPEVVAVYTQSAAVLAADWYNNQDAESSYFAMPVEGIADERLQNTATWVYGGPQKPENRLKVVANTLVFDAARNTVAQNALNEGVAVVRYEYADSCNRCVSRATVSARARNSRSDDVSADFHHSCEGMLVPVRRGLWEPPGYAREWKQRIDAARRAGNTKPDDIASWLDDH
jgi:hypothetical protein